MPDRDSVINDLNVAKRILCNPQMLTPEMCIRIGQAITSAIALLKEQEAEIEQLNRFVNGFSRDAMPVVRCKDCRYGQYCTDGETTYECFKWNSAEFGMLHEQNWFCADGERRTEDA